MNVRVRILPEAEADLTEAFVWYEEIRWGLGNRFLEAVREALHFASQHPHAGRPVHRDVRRVLTPHFPYGLFYVVERDEVVVVGCFHGRRDPTAFKIRGRRYH